MALIDHFAPDNENRLSVHSFSASLFGWAFGDFTRQDVIDTFGLDASDQIQLDALKTQYDGKNNNLKSRYIFQVEKYLILYEDNKITAGQLQNLLGI